MVHHSCHTSPDTRKVRRRVLAGIFLPSDFAGVSLSRDRPKPLSPAPVRIRHHFNDLSSRLAALGTIPIPLTGGTSAVKKISGNLNKINVECVFLLAPFSPTGCGALINGGLDCVKIRGLQR